MGRLGLAFKILFSGDMARRTIKALSGDEQPKIDSPAKPELPPPPNRSDAVTLLAALQRDARFVDFVQEDIDNYEDAQVGAAVRDIHRGCRDVLNRMFAPRPVVEQDENTDVEIHDPESARWRLTGQIGQTSGTTVVGKLMHPGWLATECRVPDWSGTADDAVVIAAAEVQID